MLPSKTAVPTKIMTEIPDAPDEFESEEELKQCIYRLHNHLNNLEEKPEESKTSKREMKKELNQIEDKITASTDELEEIHTALEGVIKSLESIELHGKPNTDELQENLRNPNFGGN
ncbi:hypothetical protein SAMN05216226_12316 [Halovenus aranensis]|uniref:Uncharacterized protein n=2 Tax=Halovenus aranensis TaxID=890420 RepID=A0A1G8ZGL3_9EURY|nr:hypothetical protein SAMN05216226_12316 [Halovenus aranensis]